MYILSQTTVSFRSSVLGSERLYRGMGVITWGWGNPAAFGGMLELLLISLFLESSDRNPVTSAYNWKIVSLLSAKLPWVEKIDSFCNCYSGLTVCYFKIIP